VRLAAVVALIAMITLGARVVSVALAHLGDLIVAFVGVLVVACCGPFALSPARPGAPARLGWRAARADRRTPSVGRGPAVAEA
jgi:hypothetical protein